MCLVAQSCPTFCDLLDSSPQAPLSMGFFRHEYWSGLQFPPLGDLSNPGVTPASPVSPARQAGSSPLMLPGKPVPHGKPLLCTSLPSFWGFLVVQTEESTCNAADLGSIPGLGRSPGDENGYPLQYSGFKNSTDRGAWQATVHGVAKTRT